jgi:hypothetical protein
VPVFDCAALVFCTSFTTLTKAPRCPKCLFLKPFFSSKEV